MKRRGEFDRDLDDAGGGGFGQAVRRVFGDGQDPLNWALPLYTAWGIRVRIHLVFVVLIIAQLIWSISQRHLGWPFMLMGMASLFVLVLLHEYGHCIACRRVGGTADQILMWPLGGLAYCDPPPTWRANLLTTLGGPAVNAALLPILGAAVWALAGPGAALFNPFDPSGAVSGLGLSGGGGSPYWLHGLWWLHYTNLILLLFNMLVPMYPMDSGRVLHALLWRSIGERRALGIAATVGLIVAVVLFVASITFGQNTLLAVSLFGGITCWMERRRLEFHEGGGAGDDLFYRSAAGLDEFRPDVPAAHSKAGLKTQEREEAEQVELDRVLAKIAQSGMESLTRTERRTLSRATERRRRG